MLISIIFSKNLVHSSSEMKPIFTAVTPFVFRVFKQKVSGIFSRTKEP